ncbi:transglycosylase domain-containing protein [Curtobacterium sp. MCSS17_015]|uniref:transglycosylase domain-containing protein n=1 Tax=Curtobacterium sp. MCSS17_015 TaxID=2175666 RepID=UPI000DA818F0|nr:transglycosylase domain-containing protein [Curtobacterium sp. MCSS17_015]WIB25460.1 transglycosylase domain-containing protein [Curtobacterium sp. MCSS17_015]
MSAQKTSARRTKPVSAVGAFVGFVGFSALAGLLVTIGVTPAIAVAGVTTTSTIGVFESLPEYIELGDLPQRNEVLAYSAGKPVHLATVYDQNRQELKYDQISDNLKNAAIDGEDKRFWDHGGVDMTSLVRAGVGTVAGGGLGDSGGGSTLTMQLVRNIKMQQALELPTQEERLKAYNEATKVSVSRKLEEMKLAIGLAKKYPKKDILTGYLNIAYFGDQTYGVQAAAQHYYGKNATDLSPAEAASILAIVQSPNTRNLSDPKYYDANVARRDVILKSMYAQEHIDKKQFDEAIASKPADYVKLTDPTQGCKAATGNGSQFFCDYAVQVVKEMSQLGSTQKQRDAAWRNGGYTIQTTLNLDLNGAQKELIDAYAPNTEARFALGGVLNSVEADTGRILTMAQNKNYNQLAACGSEGADPNACAPATDTGINYSVDRQYGGGEGFQTGSTFKPFTLLNWLQNGHGLGEIVNGTPRAFPTYTQCGSPVGVNYTPKNDAPGEGGNMTVENATYRSVNVSYVNMAQKLDYCEIRKTAESLGVHLAQPRATSAEFADDTSQKTTSSVKTNASFVLGTNYIAPLTMAAAYAGIANNGTFCRPIAIDNVTDADGKSLGGQPKDCTQAIDPQVAATAIYAMKKVLTIGTAPGARTPDGFDEFGKTGTTDEADQIWLVGSSTKVATVAWMGNTVGKQSLRYVYGPNGQYAGSRTALWRQAQTIANTQYPGGQFADPAPSSIRGNSVAVPNVQGQTPEAARAAIAGAGLTYVDGGVQAGGGTPGTVLSTNPAGGLQLSKGSSVTVYTTDGSQAAVPEVGGKELDDARSTLTQSGFGNVAVSGEYEKGDGKNECTVAAVEPGAGTVAGKDTGVTLKLYGNKNGKAPKDCR